MHKHAGFNLFELLITLVIIALLTLMALPSYTAHLAHEHRIEAEIALEKLAANLEQYQIINSTYQDATLAALGSPEFVANNIFQLSITSATETDFIITATATQDQIAKDPLCASLTLNSAGEKGITGQGKITDCW
jgi:type IV pilus assembly protein PilE